MKTQTENNSLNENVEMAVVEEIILPEEEYQSAHDKRKKVRRTITVGLLISELIIAGAFSQVLHKNDIKTRIAREHEIRKTGCIELASGIYKGATDFGYFSGDGNFIFNSGSEYAGNWEENGLKGHGVLQIPTEGKYDGEMTFPNGDKYTGSFNNGKRSGSGVYEWTSGDKYDGSWNSDQLDGSGMYTYFDGSYVNGQFEKNVFMEGEYHIENAFGTYSFTIADGKATKVKMTLTDGTTYDGSMSDGELFGQAQIKYSNGDKYYGNISGGQKNGQGKYTWNSGATYEGSWENDQMSGEGTYIYPSGKNGYKLVGTFANGKPNGSCQYYVDSTAYYQTDWSNGKCEKIYE